MPKQYEPKRHIHIKQKLTPTTVTITTFSKPTVIHHREVFKVIGFFPSHYVKQPHPLYQNTVHDSSIVDPNEIQRRVA